MANYAVLTDTSTQAQTLMQGQTPAPTKVATFTAHILWTWENANEQSVAVVQNAPQVYATVQLPDPL